MSLTAPIVHEFEQEAATTRRVLERVPEDRLTWRPHPKSMSLGELALHVAHECGALAPCCLSGSIDFARQTPPAPPTTCAEILRVHDAGVATLAKVLGQLGDEGLQRPVAVMINGATVNTMPAASFVRTVLLNHTYHHRGQLSVYLRLLDVPVPSIYGPSADENPFAAAGSATLA